MPRFQRLLALCVLVSVALGGSAEPQRAREILAHGVAAADTSPRTLVLSAEERAYLRSLPTISLGFDIDWAPFTYLDADGQPSGIATAYIAYLSKALGIGFERRAYPNWSEGASAFARGEVDMVATTERVTSSLAGGIATEAHGSFPLVIVGREGEPVVKGMAGVASRRIVVTEALAASGRLGNLAPNARPTVAPSLTAALDRVASGAADLFVGDLAAVDIALASHYEDELKILGPAGDFEHIGFAVRPELGRLVPLIDRALRAMPDADKRQILAQRQAAFEKPSGGWSVTALRLLPALIAIGVVLAITLRAFVLLQREMSRRIEIEE
jgi:two-component system, NarL family, sensor histidine kinase EvgS